MNLWSFRSVDDIALALRSRQRLFTAKSYDYEDFRVAYHWMMEQMEARFKRPGYVTLPLWAWHTYEGKCKQPDLRKFRYLKRQTPRYALFSLEIPDEYVLLSDEQLWHSVLMQSYISLDRDEDAWFDTQELRLTDAALFELKLRSWPRIFDIEINDPDWTGSLHDKSIQATTWYVKLDEIVRYQLL